MFLNYVNGNFFLLIQTHLVHSSYTCAALESFLSLYNAGLQLSLLVSLIVHYTQGHLPTVGS